MTARISAMPARHGDTPSASYRTIWQAVREQIAGPVTLGVENHNLVLFIAA